MFVLSLFLNVFVDFFPRCIKQMRLCHLILLAQFFFDQHCEKSNYVTRLPVSVTRICSTSLRYERRVTKNTTCEKKRKKNRDYCVRKNFHENEGNICLGEKKSVHKKNLLKASTMSEKKKQPEKEEKRSKNMSNYFGKTVEIILK